MKILAINGSHRVGQNTSYLIDEALNAATELGAETEVINLAEKNIEFCKGCNRCLFKPECSIKDDDMEEINQKMLDAGGIIVASPDYFSNVTARMKNFFDRTRPLHMTANQLKHKVAGYLTMAGLDNCGAESTNAALQQFCATHEMLVVHPRPEGPVIASSITGSLMAGMKDGKPQWRRSVSEDPIAPVVARQLGIDMVELIKKLA
jgi:multimeric flavodoxin WrbA